MNLAIDIGNTRTKIGIFNQDEIQTIFVFDNHEKIDIAKIIIDHNIQKAIVSSTIEIPIYLVEAIKNLKQNIFLDADTKLPFINKYSTKDTLGKDRLALVAAAQIQFPHQNNLIIGCGTCITFNFINNKNEFIGGSIHPGLKMRLQAMHTFTKKLPLIQLEPSTDLIANTTKSNMLTGVLWATSKEIDGMISDYLVKFHQMNVIITGGDTNLLVNRLKNQIFAISNFTLIGLNHILEYNA